MVLGARQNVQVGRISTSFAPIKYLNIGGHIFIYMWGAQPMRRFTPRPPVPDATAAHRAAAKNRRKPPISCTPPFMTQRISLASQIGKRYGTLRKNSHTSHPDQLATSPIFKYMYLNVAKGQGLNLGLEMAILATGIAFGLLRLVR